MSNDKDIRDDPDEKEQATMRRLIQGVDKENALRMIIAFARSSKSPKHIFTELIDEVYEPVISTKQIELLEALLYEQEQSVDIDGRPVGEPFYLISGESSEHLHNVLEQLKSQLSTEKEDHE